MNTATDVVWFTSATFLLFYQGISYGLIYINRNNSQYALTENFSFFICSSALSKRINIRYICICTFILLIETVLNLVFELYFVSKVFRVNVN